MSNINSQVNALQKGARDGWNDMKYNMGTISSFYHAKNTIEYGITDTVEVLGDLSEAFFRHLDPDNNPN